MPSDLRAGLLAVLVALPSAAGGATRDVHSFATPEDVRVRHIDLDLDIDFDARVIRGSATLRVERVAKDTSKPLVLDTRGLKIEAVESTADGMVLEKAAFNQQDRCVLGQA